MADQSPIDPATLTLKHPMTSADKARMRELTLACWWPSKFMGRKETDWRGIAYELHASAEDALKLRDDVPEALEFQRLATLVEASLPYCEEYD